MTYGVLYYLLESTQQFNHITQPVTIRFTHFSNQLKLPFDLSLKQLNTFYIKLFAMFRNIVKIEIVLPDIATSAQNESVYWLTLIAGRRCQVEQIYVNC